MTPRARAAVAAAFLLLPFFATVAPVAGQGIRVAGRVIAPGDTPVAGQTIVLHRVTAAGGVLLGEATSDDAGRFVVEADGAVPDSSVFFVATRYEGRLYLGPMLRPPIGENEVTLEVGDPARALNLFNTAPPVPPASLPGSATGTPRRWFLLLVPLAGLIGLAVRATSRATGPSPERRLLIRLASLDNRHADTDAADDAGYVRQRRRLLDELDAIG